MVQFLNLTFLAVSIGALVLGAELLVRGSSRIAEGLGVSPLTVGLTIVGFGTSAPELVVSIQAAAAQQGDLSVGNVVGSNIFNIAVILGLTALIRPLETSRQVVRFDIPVALIACVALAMLLLDASISTLDAALLMTGMVTYLGLTARTSLAENRPPEARPVVPGNRYPWLAGYVGGGLTLLALGSAAFIGAATALASAWGVSEAVIGLTIAAAGTSMPELITSTVSVLRGKNDIAVGNIVGSNIFNAFGIIGVSGLILPLSSGGIGMLDLGLMIVTAALLPVSAIAGGRITRLHGAVLLAIYVGYLALRWPSAG